VTASPRLFVAILIGFALEALVIGLLVAYA